MAYDSIVISSGHGLHIRGASGILDEVDEARIVVDQLADELRARDVAVRTFHDDDSTSQNENLERICDYHNGCDRELDISVHFNAYVETTKPMGTEVLYKTQDKLAGQLAGAIAKAGGFINRGPKKCTDLYFLNNTEEPAVLIEVCFVDSVADADLYRDRIILICEAIAEVLSGHADELPPPTPPQTGDEVLFDVIGKCSQFGGPEDLGVSASEGLAFISDWEQAPQLFLPYQPEGSTGLARRLNPYVHYVACRWDYDKTSKSFLRENIALVRAIKTGITLKAFPADWGPHEDTRRVADLSPGLMDDLGIGTDDEVQVTFPYKED